TPLCDLAADVRASTPTMAGRLVVPDLGELVQRLDRARESLGRGVRRTLDRDVQRVERTHERLRRAPALLVERKRARVEALAGKLGTLSPKATLRRGYAIVRKDGAVAATVTVGDRVDVELADSGFGARVEDVRD
ncbi:MAG TPA: exodeoxyribonuclease VII large subunit, partial [Gaiellaceae bacterium]|nr:exodeoxyribonuclease VII large subunit [Gaiellaceae bacterium]